MDQSGYAIAESARENIVAEGMPQWAQQQCSHPVVLVGTLLHFVVGIAVVFFSHVSDIILRQVHEIQPRLPTDMLHAAFDLRNRMYIRRPRRPFFDEEPQLVVAGCTFFQLIHKAVVTRNKQSLRTIVGANALIEIVVQLGCHQFVGIHHQHPTVGSLMDGKIARWLTDGILPFGKRHHAASPGERDVTGVVSALHVAHHDLVEVFHAVEYFR